MIAAHGAQHQLRGDLARPVHSQSVQAEPTEKELADHNLTHQSFAAFGVNYVLQTGHNRMDIQPDKMNRRALIHVSVLISVLHQEQSMNQKLVVFCS